MESGVCTRLLQTLMHEIEVRGQICNSGSNAHSRLDVNHTCRPELKPPILIRWPLLHSLIEDEVNYIYDSIFRLSLH